MSDGVVEPRECGRSRRRLEDERFLRGLGRYLDDIPAADGELVGQVVRSPIAHARIRGIDTEAAGAVPGVVAVYTAEDLLAAGIGPLPCVAPVASVEPLVVPPRHALAAGRVRHVGDPVAFVVAENIEAARSAAEAVEVDYEEFPAIVDMAEALAPGATEIWPEAPGNLAFRYLRGNRAAVEAAFAGAAHVVSLELDNNRVVAAPLETRGAIAQWDAASGFLLTLSGQGVHEMREQLASDIFRMPRERVQVVAPDVGGGFGPKNVLYPEYVLLLFAARALGRPVRWTSERSEDFVSSAHSRGNRTRARLALDAEARVLALEVETLADMGAYLSAIAPLVPTGSASNAMGGVYAIPAVHLDVRAVYTNTVPIDAYRGAGKPEANYLVERLVELAARRLSLSPFEIRRRNMVSRFPAVSAFGIPIEAGAFARSLDRVAEAADVAGFPTRRTAAGRRGRLAGIGLSAFLETARGAPGEWARVLCAPDGTVTLAVGTQSNGQGHETTFPQVAADRLGLPVEAFRYVQADTRLVADGKGHGGARSLYQGGTALVEAIDVMLAKARDVAARLLQAEAASLAFTAGAFATPGDARRLTLAEIAAAMADPEQMAGQGPMELAGEAKTTHDAITFPNGCHIAEVEIDPETGETTLLRYVAVDDYGTLVNPLLTEGQVQGGIAQGIGQAAFEHTAYDASGQLLAGSFMDYRLPRAADLPDIEIVFDESVPSAANPLGVKGAGQAGAIGAPQTVIHAILDALAPLGIAHIEMPATPQAVWRAIHRSHASNGHETVSP